jgi:hypothetical protein
VNRYVESALAACGRDRVMHREEHNNVAIAIRYDLPGPAVSPDGTERYLVRKASTIDEAGREAARSFATHLRAEARKAIEWAERIERVLAREAEEAP